MLPLSFAEAQVSAGRSVFNTNCTGCHGQNLEGVDAPPLSGELIRHWFVGSVAPLYQYITNTMPLGDAGSLSPTQYAAVTAYILSRIGFTAGVVPLPETVAELEAIGFTP